jgi:hypothetical protein
MENQIFANKIDDKKFIEIKVPVHMPTIQDWTEYAVVSGQFQMNGSYYNYVKLKMTRDTMFFVCIPNETKTHLEKADVIISKEINDIQPAKKGQPPVAKKINALSEYRLQAFQYEYYPFGKYLDQSGKSVLAQLCDPYISSPGKPPNFTS